MFPHPSSKFEIETFEKEELAFYAKAEDHEGDDYELKGYGLTVKGDILFTLKDAPDAINVKFDNHFVYVYENNIDFFRVFNKDGDKVTEQGNYVHIPIDSEYKTQFIALGSRFQKDRKSFAWERV